MSPKESKRKNFIQFRTYDENLRQRINDDIANSSFKDKTDYMNSLVEGMLDAAPLLGKNSQIEEFIGWADLRDALPLDKIAAIAPEQNRQFDQMLKHVIEVGLAYCTRDPFILREHEMRAQNMFSLSAHEDRRKTSAENIPRQHSA